jgi:hypothetical protein
MAKQSFSSGQTLTAQQMNDLQTNDFNWTVSTQTANYTLQATDKGTREVMNMASAGTVTVPDSTFNAGDIVWVHSIGSGTITVAAGTGMTLNSSAGSAPTLAQWEGGVVYFTSASSSIFFRSGPTSIAVEYLVIGGGAGTGSGGGGAGGYRCSVPGETSGGGSSAEVPFYPVKGTSYTITVGGGGAANTNGSDSSIGSTVIAYGGGYGSPSGNLAPRIGGSGGGGGGGVSIAGAGGLGSQGYSGGTGGSPFPNDNGGGGGGAGAVGATGSSGNGGAGGNGVASSITGSSVTRGGGGGGQSRNSFTSSGGSGGGGSGGNAGSGPVGGTAGGTNTGGGAGGGYDTVASGGSGVVILRSKTAAASTTGSPSVSTTGAYTVYTFTGNGSITW